MKKNLRSDAALKRANKEKYLCGGVTGEPGNWTVKLWPAGEDEIAEINLKDIISKRASLKGIEARMRKAVRTPAKRRKAR